jgi:hypothetical protein
MVLFFVIVVSTGVGSSIVYSARNWTTDNQFLRWPFYPMLAFMAVTIVANINFLNKALALFSTAVISPIYYVSFTTATLVSAAVLFQGFPVENVASGLGIVMGFLVIVGGVSLLFQYDLKLRKAAALEVMPKVVGNGGTVGGNGSRPGSQRSKSTRRGRSRSAADSKSSRKLRKLERKKKRKGVLGGYGVDQVDEVEVVYKGSSKNKFGDETLISENGSVAETYGRQPWNANGNVEQGGGDSARYRKKKSMSKHNKRSNYRKQNRRSYAKRHQEEGFDLDIPRNKENFDDDDNSTLSESDTSSCLSATSTDSELESDDDHVDLEDRKSTRSSLSHVVLPVLSMASNNHNGVGCPSLLLGASRSNSQYSHSSSSFIVDMNAPPVPSNQSIRSVKSNSLYFPSLGRHYSQRTNASGVNNAGLGLPPPKAGILRKGSADSHVAGRSIGGSRAPSPSPNNTDGVAEFMTSGSSSPHPPFISLAVAAAEQKTHSHGSINTNMLTVPSSVNGHRSLPRHFKSGGAAPSPTSMSGVAGETDLGSLGMRFPPTVYESHYESSETTAPTVISVTRSGSASPSFSKAS